MLLIPEILLKQHTELLMLFYYNNYKNSNQANADGYNDMTQGFDGTTQTSTINGVTITIFNSTSDLESSVISLNNALSVAGLTNMEFYEVVNTISLRTIANSTSLQTLILVDQGLFSTLGIEAGTYTGQSSKENTYLYQLFGSLEYDKYIYLNEIYLLLENTFLKTTAKNSLRKISIRTDYNPNLDLRPPVIIFSLSNEENQSLIDRGNETNVNGSIIVRNRLVKCDYKLSIISDNKNDCILLYNFLKALFEANSASFAYIGILNISVSGGNSNIEIEMPNMFTYVLNLTFDYQTQIPVNIDTDFTFKNIYFKPTYL